MTGNLQKHKVVNFFLSRYSTEFQSILYVLSIMDKAPFYLILPFFSSKKECEQPISLHFIYPTASNDLSNTFAR